MKKIFLFLAVASMTAFTSCSSDDDSNDGGTTDPNAATGVVLASNVQAITLGESVTFTVTDNNANVVTGASTLLVDNVEISGATFTPNTAGSFAVKATYMNSNDVTLTSNTVTITVAEPVVAAGNITVDGTAYPVNASLLVFWGGYAEDPNAEEATHGLWSYVMTDDETGDVVSAPSTANNYIDVEMIVPIVDNSAPFPTPANAEYLDFYEAYVNNAEVAFTSQEGGSMVLGEFPEAINSAHTFSSSSMYNAGSTLTTVFDGTWLGFIDATADAKSAVATNSKKSFAVKKVMTKAEVLKLKAKFFASLKK